MSGFSKQSSRKNNPKHTWLYEQRKVFLFTERQKITQRPPEKKQRIKQSQSHSLQVRDEEPFIQFKRPI